MVCDGLISRVFQHEIDHLDGKTMEEQAKGFKSINEIQDPKEYDKFYEEQKKYIIEY